MNIEAFRQRLPELWSSDPQIADHPTDRAFKPVIEKTKGMATENKLAVLNLAASLLAHEESFLEIGTYRGTSIIGASLKNPTQRFVAIDNFSQFEGSEEQCRKNLQVFGCQNVELINSDAWAVLEDRRPGAPIGAYFYDGGHKFSDQWKALSLITPLLADQALIIIDDASHKPVAAATRTFAAANPRFELLFWFESPSNGEPRWWNGLAIYGFRRSYPDGRAAVGSKFKRRFYEMKYGRIYEFLRPRIIPPLKLAIHRLRASIKGRSADKSEP